jgi:hypothetical protein
LGRQTFYVNMGGQKNFVQFAKRIGQDWEKNQDKFNEFYYKRLIARAIILKKMEKLVQSQPWYRNGFRANIVNYTIALFSKISSDMNKSLDYMKIWDLQDIPESLIDAITVTSKIVFDEITDPSHGVSNVSEWCKREACWDKMQLKIKEVKSQLPKSFIDSLI